MVLSKPLIKKHLKAGNIVIDPFNEKNLSNTSYDVRLGKYFFRQSEMPHTQAFNPFHEGAVKRLYSKVEEAIPVSKMSSGVNSYEGLSGDDLVILIAPSETILAHTIEFIGGRNGVDGLPAVTAEMRARSSLGRVGISVCKDAGWGDIGYVNRWTMEITNFSSSIVVLPVGLRVAQIIFHTTEPVGEEDIYSKGGKYQKDLDLEGLKEKWSPYDMLPRLYKDWDLKDYRRFGS